MPNQNKDGDRADRAWSDGNMRGGVNLWRSNQQKINHVDAYSAISLSLWLKERSPHVGETPQLTSLPGGTKTQQEQNKTVCDQYNFCALEVKDWFKKKKQYRRSIKENIKKRGRQFKKPLLSWLNH